MAHEVETMAWTNEVPWHGLGVQVPDNISVDEMIKQANLDWSVSKRPLYAQNPETGKADILVPDKQALVRDSDNRILSTVGTRWHPTQNVEAFDFFRRIVEPGRARMSTAGSLRNGQIVWGLADLGQGFSLRGGDEVNGYLLLMLPHMFGCPVSAKVTNVRVVCNNTLTLALRQESKFEARFSHVRAFDPDLALETLGVAKEQIAEFERNARIIQKLELSHQDAGSIVASVYQPEFSGAAADGKIVHIAPESWSRTTNRVMQAYEHAPGATPGNGWGVLNAVTYHADHRAGNDNQDRRLTSAWTGTEAARKERTLAVLLQLAA